MESSFAQQQFEEQRRFVCLCVCVHFVPCDRNPVLLIWLLLISDLAPSLSLSLSLPLAPSSRIGRQEDTEDIRKEAERLSRKRRKGAPASAGPRGLKQSKLSFR